MDIQIVVVLLQVSHGHIHDVLPQRPVAPAALLQLQGSLVRLVGEFGIGFLCGGGGVDLLQIGDGEGSNLGVLPGEAFVKIGQLRLPLLKLGDDETHLQSPVAQVHIADGVVAQELVQPLQGFADDGRPQVADVQGLCHIGSAVVHHDGLALTDFLHAEVGGGAHGFQIICQKRAGGFQVDEARHHGLAQIIVAFVQLSHHFLGDFDGSALILLGSGQGAVALIFAQVGAVGNRHPSKGRLIPRRSKRLLHFGCDDVQDFFHKIQTPQIRDMRYKIRDIR